MKWRCKILVKLIRILIVGFVRKENRYLDLFVVLEVFIEGDKYFIVGYLEKSVSVEIWILWNYMEGCGLFYLEYWCFYVNV